MGVVVSLDFCDAMATSFWPLTVIVLPGMNQVYMYIKNDEKYTIKIYSSQTIHCIIHVAGWTENCKSQYYMGFKNTCTVKPV